MLTTDEQPCQPTGSTSLCTVPVKRDRDDAAEGVVEALSSSSLPLPRANHGNEEEPPHSKKLAPAAHYFAVDDIVWIRPDRHPYWPGEVVAVDSRKNTVTCRLFSPPPTLATSTQVSATVTTTNQDGTCSSCLVTRPAKVVYFFDKLASDRDVEQVVEDRLNRKQHDVSGYEQAFVQAVHVANSLVRIVLSPERLEPFCVCGIGVVHSFMRTHVSAPRQPSTAEFVPQTAVIVLKEGLENAVRDLKGFERIWVLFHFSYSVGLRNDRGGSDGGSGVGWKTMVVPPRDTVLRGVFATRSPHRPNGIGLSCVRLLDVRGLEVHIADHDLLHGTPVLDIKPYLPFCDAHPLAKAGWVQDLDERGAGLSDHRGGGAAPDGSVAVHRVFQNPPRQAGDSRPLRPSSGGVEVGQELP